MARLTQAQRRERTREQLFLATLLVAAERGIEGVSTHRVAAAAGMSVGAIYGNFDNKDHLVREAMGFYRAHATEFDVPDATGVRDLLQRRTRTVFELSESTDPTIAAIVRFQHQFPLLAASDDEVAALLLEWDEARVTHLARRIVRVAGDRGEQLAVPARLLARQVLGLTDAFQALRMRDRELAPDRAIAAAIDAVIDDALAPRGTGRPRRRRTGADA